MISVYKKTSSKQSYFNWVLLISIFFCVITASAEDGNDYIHYRLGVKYKNDKKYDEAIEEFRKVLAAYPENYNAYMHMAEIRAMQDRPRLVIYNLKKALSYNSGWGKAHKLLAASYEKDGQIQKAIVELQQYQQSCDPAEKDSLQNQIERLINKVNSNEGSVVSSDSSYQSPSQVSSQKNITNNSIVKKDSIPTSGIKKQSLTEDTQKQSNPKIEEVFITAVQLYKDKKYKEALEQIRNLLKLDPRHAGGYYYAGLIRYRYGQNKMAKINFSQSINFPELGHNSHYYLGKILASEKKYPEAITQLSLYISKTSYEPGKSEAVKLVEQYKNLISGEAILPAKQSDPEKNNQESTFSVQQPPVAQEKYVQLEIQIDSMLSMLTVDTLTDAGQKLLAGILAFRDGNFEKAILEFKKVLAANPAVNTAVSCIYNIGISYLKMSLFKDAENQFQQIIDRYSNHLAASKSHFLKALTYLERNESVTAEKLFRNFIQNYQSSSWVSKAFEKLGDCYVDMEQLKKAVDAYSHSMQKCSSAEKIILLFKSGNIFLKLGNESRAIKSFSDATAIGEKQDIHSRIPDCYYRIADTYYKAKDYQNSLANYIKVTRKYPAFQETPWGLFQIGSIYKNLNQHQKAINVFKDLIRRYPDDYWAKQAQWKMEDSIWENEYRTVLN